MSCLERREDEVRPDFSSAPVVREVAIPLDGAALGADLTVPSGARGVVVFAHGSGSGRNSPRNRAVAEVLHRAGLGTLLMDLLTPAESLDPGAVFDFDRMVPRLAAAVRWTAERPETAGLEVGCFGASTGAAVALRAAASGRSGIRAVVSRGGRPDLAEEALDRVRCPVLLIVGGADTEVLELNRAAYRRLRGEKNLEVVAGATHLFAEPGTLDTVAGLAAHWFRRHLGRTASAAARSA